MEIKRDFEIPIFFTVKETAEILRLTERTIYSYIKSGKIEAKKFGHDWRISKEALQAYLDSI